MTSRRLIAMPLALMVTACTTASRSPAQAAAAASRSRTRSAAGRPAEARVRSEFTRAGVGYPPRRVDLLVFKEERSLELWASRDGPPVFVRAYPVTAASGSAGPKLRQGDRQVPEGFYQITLLNPSSSYHLSLKLDYPNAFDRQMARREGRTDPGGDIFIHGRAESLGCIAVGDVAIEELFTVVERAGLASVRVVIAPRDLRYAGPPPGGVSRPWVHELWAQLTAELAHYRR